LDASFFGTGRGVEWPPSIFNAGISKKKKKGGKKTKPITKDARFQERLGEDGKNRMETGENKKQEKRHEVPWEKFRRAFQYSQEARTVMCGGGGTSHCDTGCGKRNVPPGGAAILRPTGGKKGGNLGSLGVSAKKKGGGGECGRHYLGNLKKKNEQGGGWFG